MLRPSTMSCLLCYTIEVFLNNLSALDPRLCPAQGSSLTAPSSPIPHWFGIDTDPYPFVDAAGLVLRSRSSPKDIPFYRHEVSLSHNQKKKQFTARRGSSFRTSTGYLAQDNVALARKLDDADASSRYPPSFSSSSPVRSALLFCCCS